MKTVKILGTAIALPKHVVKSTDIDLQQHLPVGKTEKISGVVSRHHATTESATDLAVDAINDALSVASLTMKDIDCLISASGTMEQAIPYNAAKIHARLKCGISTPAFDVNMTCLSALMAMDVATSMIQCGQYKNILIVSSDIASVGINWSDKETAGLFGDGAAAVIMSHSDNPHAGVLTSHFETHSTGVEYCQIRGGGSLNHVSKIDGCYKDYGLFEMQGKEVYKLTAKVIEDFIATLLGKVPCVLSDIDWIVPHQASSAAISHLQKRLRIPKDKIINILSTRGNQIAASIPSALHELYQHKPIKPGDKVLIIGTSAGLSLGGMVLVI